MRHNDFETCEPGTQERLKAAEATVDAFVNAFQRLPGSGLCAQAFAVTAQAARDALEVRAKWLDR